MNEPPYREGTIWPPPTKPPTNPGMGRQFDRLVETNLTLVKTVQYAIFVLVGLTTLAVGTAAYSAWNLQRTVGTILEKCYPARLTQ